MRNSLPLLAAFLLVPIASAGEISVQEFTVAGKPAVVVQPPGDGPWPVVYTLSGLGEMKRGPKVSAWGWVKHYGLVEAMAACHRGALTSKDFNGLVTPELLKRYNIKAARYQGLVVIGTPAPISLTDAYQTHLFTKLIPWAEANLPILKGPAHRGIDGISLGGRHALRIGLRRPEQFATLGTEQAAAKGLDSLARRQHAKNPKALAGLQINLVTSQKDGFRGVVVRLYRALSKLGLNVRLHITPGRHDKRFASGPGVLDMLLFHDARLR